MSGRSKRYRVRQNNGKERKTITDENGRNFLCPYEAHTFWQYEKYKHLNTLAMRYISEKGSRKDVYEAICNRAQDILDQRNKGEITTFI